MACTPMRTPPSRRFCENFLWDFLLKHLLKHYWNYVKTSGLLKHEAADLPGVWGSGMESRLCSDGWSCVYTISEWPLGPTKIGVTSDLRSRVIARGSGRS